MNQKEKLRQLEEKLDNHINYNKGTKNYEKILGFIELSIENLKAKIITQTKANRKQPRGLKFIDLDFEGEEKDRKLSPALFPSMIVIFKHDAFCEVSE